MTNALYVILRSRIPNVSLMTVLFGTFIPVNDAETIDSKTTSRITYRVLLRKIIRRLPFSAIGYAPNTRQTFQMTRAVAGCRSWINHSLKAYSNKNHQILLNRQTISSVG